MLTEAETDTLLQAAGLIIPASEAYDVPGADDLLIMAEIAVSAAREAGAVRAALTASVVLDHFGWATFPQHDLSLGRVAGVLLLFAGVFLIRRY